MADRKDKAGASERTSPPDPHVDGQSGARVPTPDPKDQTGDPEGDNAAMRELRKRRNPAEITES
jgi:hypothetical protein